MFLLEGGLALFAAAVLYTWAAWLHHRSDAPGWARAQGFASVVSLVLVGLVPLGAGLLTAGAGEPMTPLAQAGLAAVAAAALLMLLQLRAR